ncbi:hypothetical protein BKA61DRAFT_670573 [Leptodontidium sp. MPI-SDFR-AT-0119]|nr:hypothetical protein BKA61DRAFT_670573 [Leptodontidium sp. MPI-SDFR-AT-0119]
MRLILRSSPTSATRSQMIIRDVKKGWYSDPNRVHKTNHVGKYYNVPGPHICVPSPQCTPVFMQVGTSCSGKRFAAKNAEAIFLLLAELRKRGLFWDDYKVPSGTYRENL